MFSSRNTTVQIDYQGRCVTGSNDEEGQLQVPDTLTHAVYVEAGAYHSCAVDLAGELQCWGSMRQIRVRCLPRRFTHRWLAWALHILARWARCCAGVGVRTIADNAMCRMT